MSDFAGAPSGGNGEKDSGVSDGEISVDREPGVQCGHRFGLIGDVGLELEALENASWVAVRDTVRDGLRI